MQPVVGFSKLSKEEKIAWVLGNNPSLNRADLVKTLKSFWHGESRIQNFLDQISENSLTNFVLPFGVAPNFLINDTLYCAPMVIEESSVVAAAANGANFWLRRGGFRAKVLSTRKTGQVHFYWRGEPQALRSFFERQVRQRLWERSNSVCANMISRGGGLSSIELKDMSDVDPGYFQLSCSFETCDAHGANFINSNLELFAEVLRSELRAASDPALREDDLTIIMAIVSNYTPESLVHCEVSCPVADLGDHGQSPRDTAGFAWRFVKAVEIARHDVHRATTHNKGIFNGVDAVILATGNDFRAVEACGHAYAARDGRYRGLTSAVVEGSTFRFSLELPLAVGTTGGLTSLHPLAKVAMGLLGNPSARELMQIVAAVGLAQNFQAIRSLVTTGIQKGHMRMHLFNILNQYAVPEDLRSLARDYFADKTVSFSAVREFLVRVQKKAFPAK